jgi:hypothetical protein
MCLKKKQKRSLKNLGGKLLSLIPRLLDYSYFFYSFIWLDILKKKVILSPFFLVYKIKGLKNEHAFNIAEIIKVSSWDLVESFFLVYYDHVYKKWDLCESN